MNYQEPFAKEYLEVNGKPWVRDKDLLYKVAKRALEPNALEMGAWHTCETTHCIAGWAIVMTEGAEKVFKNICSHYIIGRALLGLRAARHFYDSNSQATKYLQGVVKRYEAKVPK